VLDANELESRETTTYGMMRRQAEPGTVYLVGAGPGDPDLITVRGLDLLGVADVVVYDRLIHPALLERSHPAAERIYVGKESGDHTCSQEEINHILIDQARLGRSVVRLKGGDPFVYGRGGEECLALAAAGIPFHVVPGITSSISAPSAAGIPVTHRGVSSSFTVVTGHSCRRGEDPDWTALARAGTLIVLMGLRRLPAITEQLIASGMDPSTPAAVVASATTRDQTTVVGDLRTIGIRSRRLDPPATVIIGEVVSLRPWIAWFDEQPSSEFDLFGHHHPVRALAS
jgi:uroporphyrin-III C-methyltransferase